MGLTARATRASLAVVLVMALAALAVWVLARSAVASASHVDPIFVTGNTGVEDCPAGTIGCKLDPPAAARTRTARSPSP